MSAKSKLWLGGAIAAIVLAILVQLFRGGEVVTEDYVSYSAVLRAIEAGKVTTARLSECTIVAELTDGQTLLSSTPCGQQGLLDALVVRNIEVWFDRDESDSFMQWILYWIPSILMVGVYIYFLRGVLQALNGISEKLTLLRAEIAQIRNERSAS